MVRKSELFTKISPGQSQIGDTDGSTISTADWKQIEGACFLGVETINARLRDFVTPSGVASYLLVSIVVVGIILRSLTKGHETRWTTWLRWIEMGSGSVWVVHLYRMLSALVFTLLAVQFWAFFRLRRLQKDVIRAAGGEFSDERWTFGQIVAVIVYVPVFVEVTFSWSKRSLYYT